MDESPQQDLSLVVCVAYSKRSSAIARGGAGGAQAPPPNNYGEKKNINR